MLRRKTLALLEDPVFAKKSQRSYETYIETLDPEEKMKIEDRRVLRLPCERHLEVPVIPVAGSRADLVFASLELKDPVPIRKFRHITDFIDIMHDNGLLDLSETPEISGIPDSSVIPSETQKRNREFYAFLDRVSVSLKSFPGKKEIFRAALMDFKKTWFDSMSSVKYAVLSLTVPVDAVIVSGNIVRVALAGTCGTAAEDPKLARRADLLLFEHQGLQFKSDWKFYALGRHESWFAEDKVSGFLGEPGTKTARHKKVAELLGVSVTKVSGLLENAESPLAAFLKQFVG